MPTGTENSRSRQYAFRLPHDLDNRLETYMQQRGLSRNRAVIALLEIALEQSGYGGIQERDTPPVSEDPSVMERLAALEAALASLQTPAAPVQPEPAVKTAAGTFDPDRHYLGPLCERGHEWQDTGQSRYARGNRRCMACEAEDAKARRARQKERTAG
jgi:hypothetical protein